MFDDRYKRLSREVIIYLFPPALIIVCYLMFHFFALIAGTREGYLLGMIFYWLVWCIVPAFFWISKANRRLLFRFRKINGWQILLALIPVALALVFGPMRQRIGDATAVVIVLSLPYAFINAVSEELLWRGTFFVHHQGNYFHAVFVPSVWFGIWHYAPLSLQPASGGNLSFILAAIGLGLCWGSITFYTRSLFWSIVSHTLVDFSGLGALYYLSR